MLLQKMFKLRVSEMPFPAFSEGRKESAVVSCFFFYRSLVSCKNKRMKETLKKDTNIVRKIIPIC